MPIRERADDRVRMRADAEIDGLGRLQIYAAQRGKRAVVVSAVMRGPDGDLVFEATLRVKDTGDGFGALVSDPMRCADALQFLAQEIRTRSRCAPTS